MSNVEHPKHYNSGQIETISVIEDWNLGFHLGNAIKYISRASHKGTPKEDLEKAIWYLQRYVDNMETIDVTTLGDKERREIIK